MSCIFWLTVYKPRAAVARAWRIDLVKAVGRWCELDAAAKWQQQQPWRSRIQPVMLGRVKPHILGQWRSPRSKRPKAGVVFLGKGAAGVIYICVITKNTYMSVCRNAIERFFSKQYFQLGGWNLLYRILNKLAPVPFLFVVCADAPVMPYMASI